uniref:Uncharacterized protein n=1 Tax=Oryza sativa subsp. japonica TaxID=39947 RepID=Q69PP6_ORYSJ|nr:hypothetical protein [Oryza sativa Japonica Group]
MITVELVKDKPVPNKACAACAASPVRQLTSPSPSPALRRHPPPRPPRILARNSPDRCPRRRPVALPPLYRPSRLCRLAGHCVTRISPEHRRAAPASPSASPEFPRSALPPPMRRRPRHHHLRHRSAQPAGVRRRLLAGSHRRPPVIPGSRGVRPSVKPCCSSPAFGQGCCSPVVVFVLGSASSSVAPAASRLRPRIAAEVVPSPFASVVPKPSPPRPFVVVVPTPRCVVAGLEVHGSASSTSATIRTGLRASVAKHYRTNHMSNGISESIEKKQYANKSQINMYMQYDQ